VKWKLVSLNFQSINELSHWGITVQFLFACELWCFYGAAVEDSDLLRCDSMLLDELFLGIPLKHKGHRSNNAVSHPLRPECFSLHIILILCMTVYLINICNWYIVITRKLIFLCVCQRRGTPSSNALKSDGKACFIVKVVWCDVLYLWFMYDIESVWYP
jgi:hypothetical protein